MQSTFLKGLTLFVFFGLIVFFVACKTGALDKKNPPPRKMGGSKSGAIFNPDEKTAAKDSAPPKIEIDPQWMHSSKSGRMFEPLLPDTIPADTPKQDK
jgi:hypothetical protein